MNLVNLKGYYGNLLFLGMRFLIQPNAGMGMLGEYHIFYYHKPNIGMVTFPFPSNGSNPGVTFLFPIPNTPLGCVWFMGIIPGKGVTFPFRAFGKHRCLGIYDSPLNHIPTKMQKFIPALAMGLSPNPWESLLQ